jgi:hypothetical protein
MMAVGTDTYDGMHKEFADILKFIELNAHRAGWRKQQSTIYRLHQLPTEDTDSLRYSHYEVSGHVLTPDLGSSPDQAMRTMAILLESPLAPLALATLDDDEARPPMAHAFMGEALHNENREDIIAFRTQDDATIDDLSKLPNTVLARYCIGVTGDDDEIVALYRRQDTDQILWISADVIKASLAGPHATIITQLIRLHRADITACRRVQGPL